MVRPWIKIRYNRCTAWILRGSWRSSSSSRSRGRGETFSIPSVISKSRRRNDEFIPILMPAGGNEFSAHGYVNHSPASDRPLCQVHVPSTEEVNSAIEFANDAFPQWSSHYTSAERGHILNEMARRLTTHQEDLVYLEALDTGIPVSQIRVNHVPYAIQTLEYYAALAIANGDAMTSSGRTFETPTSFSFTRREALGVCAAIGPWNYPLVSMVWKIAPALACGNTVVFKPSECTPMTALHAAALWKDVLPPGILQVLTGEADTAKQLVQHVNVAKVSVTGSVSTGISVAQDSAPTLKRTTLELGGKSPLLIFSDANLDSAVRVAVEGNYVNNGQVCSNCTRVYVQQQVLDEFLSRAVSRIKSATVIGDNMRQDVNMGPLMKPPRNPSSHFDRVMRYIDLAKNDECVELIYGGKGQFDGGGYFVEPTIFFSKSDSATICREETFGPIMTVLSFENEEEAIARANNSPYGLAAGVMTRDVARAHRVSRALLAGNVWVNNWNICPVEMPFGPYKMSGYGQELGIEALYSYSQTKHVYMEMNDVDDESTVFKSS